MSLTSSTAVDEQPQRQHQSRKEASDARCRDGAVGLMALLAAKQLGAERITAMSRHANRQELARFYGAIDIVQERGDQGVAKIRN
jgi:Zn-dependent alcohol dehydrogenase